MISRRAFLLFCSVLLAAPRTARAQRAQRAARIGLLTTRPSAVFEQALRDLGWIEETNLVIERRISPIYETLARSAKELAELGVDVIVCTNAPSAQAARSATDTIPIVMLAGDPVASGLVASLARPGGNVTGLTIMHTELSGKRLELLVEVLPGAKRVAVLSNGRNPSTAAMLRETDARARALGIELVRFEATTLEALAPAFAAMARQRVAGVTVLGDPFFNSQARVIVRLALQHRLAGVYEWGEIAGAGGLIAYGPRRDDPYRRLATYVDKILKGAKPADLAVEQPTTFELVINLKTAKALGITIPPSLLLRADHAIE